MTRNEIEEKVKTLLIEDLEVEEENVYPESRLKEDMGIDSLDYVVSLWNRLAVTGITGHIVFAVGSMCRKGRNHEEHSDCQYAAGYSV